MELERIKKLCDFRDFWTPLFQGMVSQDDDVQQFIQCIYDPMTDEPHQDV